MRAGLSKVLASGPSLVKRHRFTKRKPLACDPVPFPGGGEDKLLELWQLSHNREMANPRTKGQPRKASGEGPGPLVMLWHHFFCSPGLLVTGQFFSTFSCCHRGPCCWGSTHPNKYAFLLYQRNQSTVQMAVSAQDGPTDDARERPVVSAG